MSDDKQKLLTGFGANRVNDTQNTSSSKNNILPGAGQKYNFNDNYEEEGCGGKVKKYKWWIAGLVLLAIIGLILGLTLGKKDDNPNPPGPGPTPINVYNPYEVDQSTVVTKNQVVTGILRADRGKLEMLNKMAPTIQDGDVIKAAPQQVPTGNNNQLISNIHFEFGQADSKVAYMRLTDANNQRYSIPTNMVNKPSFQETMRLDMCGFQLFNNPFGFQFTDDRTGNAYLSTENSAFIMQDKYMQLDINLPSRRIFGLGERTKDFLLGEGTWTMWANGQETPFDDGKGGKQTYGVHPFMLVQSSTKSEYFGLFFRNSNAMSPIIQYTDGGKALFSYITTGGQIEIYFMFKGDPGSIISQYHNIIGKPTLTPFWSLGWHASAYAYQNQSDIQNNIDGYAAADIPLEGIWLDIPYMNKYYDFTVDTVKFPSLKNLTDTCHANGQRVIPIIDAGISSNDTQNKYFAAAAANNSLLRSTAFPDEQEGFLSQHVWPFENMNVTPAHTVFLDFFQNEAKGVWAMGINDLHQMFPFDGIWLDMNEATGFCNGECPDGLVPYYNSKKPADTTPKEKSWFHSFLGLEDEETVTNHTWWLSYNGQQNVSTYDLPFIPGGRWNLDNMSLSLNATHPSNNLTEYDLHSLYGHSEGKATFEIMTDQTLTPNKNKRPFLLARSTFAGSGQYVQHWLGDNHRTWDDMRYSIAGVMNFQMFGIPMVGPDTCGFFGTSGQDEICARWIQLATFYPFARQHRDISGGGDANEPWNLQEPYKSMARNALYDRLQYMRQMYTCLYETSQFGGTCYDPVAFRYPDLDDAHNDYEQQFISAGWFLVTPVLQPNTTFVTSYFPNGNWVSMKNFSQVLEVNDPSGGKNLTMSADMNEFDTINVYLVPGAIVQFQNNSAHEFKTTAAIQANGTTALIINPDGSRHANGNVFLDDGERLDTLQNRQYEFYRFVMNGGTLQKWNYNTDNQASVGVKINKIVITNAGAWDEINFACIIDTTGKQLNVQVDHDKDAKLINFTNLNDTNGLTFFDFQYLYFGDVAKDINMCNPSTQFYSPVDGKVPDLSGPTATVDLVNSSPNVFPTLSMNMSLLVSHERQSLNIHWTFKDPQGKIPFEMPEQIININRNAVNTTGVLSDFVTVGTNAQGAMTLEIKNGPSGVKVWDLNAFALGEYFNMIDAQVHTNPTNFKGVFGLFEQVSNDLFLPDGIYTLWSRDVADPVQTGKLPGQNMYGVHPFYMAKATDNTWFGVFQNNAAAQDWTVQNNPATGDVHLNTKATGGAGDMFFFFAVNPDELTMTYHSIVGFPVATPQWALGWSQCRWGYKTLDTVKQVVANYTKFNLLLDTQWSDIDYLNDYQDFTYDPVNFKGLGDFVDELHTKNLHYIPIIDAGVAMRTNYQAYQDGVAQDVFIKNPSGKIFTGQVWPTDAAFPDWFAPNTASWWSNQLTNLWNQIKFDGLWEDMNEASNFCTGTCYDSDGAANPVKNILPYTPGGRNLEEKSITLDAKHANGYTELDVHSLFGTMEVKATHDWFLSQGKRPMIIERSAYAGLGKYGSRWLGDNFSQAAYMGYSVTGIMAHNIAGIPLAGSDICGFLGNTTPELCARWYMVGAFYPFSRNHNGWDSAPQEPWIFQEAYDKTFSYLDIIRHAQEVKHHMIRYYYTELMLATAVGGAMYKPLWFAFPDDAGSYTASQNHNIWLGPHLKLSIQSNTLSKDGGDSTDFYFPAGLWCDLFNSSCVNVAQSSTYTMSTKPYEFYLHMYQGSVIPMQDGSMLHKQFNVSNTAGLQQYPVDLHILPYCHQVDTLQVCDGWGRYINDDGETLKANDVNFYYFDYVQDVTNEPNRFVLNITHVQNATERPNNIVNKNDGINTIQIYNAAAMNLNVAFTAVATMMDDSTQNLANAVYDATKDKLVFTNDVTTVPDLWLPQVKWIVFTKAA